MQPPEARTMHAIVTGRVQGVGFRWSAVREARGLGLAGVVSNRYDGSVEVYAEGPEASLARFAAWLNKGPPGAHVRNVTIEWISRAGGYSGFNVDF